MNILRNVILFGMLIGFVVVMYDTLTRDYRVTGYNAECARAYRETLERDKCLDRKLVYYRDHESVALKAAADALKAAAR